MADRERRNLTCAHDPAAHDSAALQNLNRNLVDCACTLNRTCDRLGSGICESEQANNSNRYF